MIRPVSAARPVDVLRQSSDQIRRAAALLAEITDNTAASPDERYQSSRLQILPAGGDEAATAREATIRTAQRSFSAGLRMAQHRDRATD